MLDKILYRSFSLPNLTFTPLEALLPTQDEIIRETEKFYYADEDFEPPDNSPTKSFCQSENQIEFWDDGQNYGSTNNSQSQDENIFSFLESQRVRLESRLGVEALLKVYKAIAKLENGGEEEKLSYYDLTKILGKGNEDLIDDIIQLVVADQFFNIGNGRKDNKSKQ